MDLLEQKMTDIPNDLPRVDDGNNDTTGTKTNTGDAATATTIPAVVNTATSSVPPPPGNTATPVVSNPVSVRL
jgi:hypothetical protein